MRETKFIQQNQEKWREFEKTMEQPRPDPDKLNDLFVQITDDLSYSRTFYPNRSVRVYLNSLAQRIFFSIYKSKKRSGNRLIRFWADDLPQLVYESRAAFRLSFFVFALAFLIGVVSSTIDPDFANIILGEAYVEMTMENIQSGDPMAVYKQKGEFGMSLGITINNLFVALRTFVMGVFFMIGTLIDLIRTGVMVGGFQYFFVEKGLFWESFLTIWTHGTLEISAIIIAGAAGITMGHGLVFPGTYTRLQSFQRSARRGVKIMIGITPVIIMAGFIEGYLTRHTDTPDVVRGLFIGLCLLFVLFYFVWLPWLKSRRGFDHAISETTLSADKSQWIRFQEINSSGEIFSQVFILYSKYLSSIAGVSFISSGVFVLGILLTGTGAISDWFYFPNQMFGTIQVFDQFFINDSLPFLAIINALAYALTCFWVYRLLLRENGSHLSANWFSQMIPFFKILVVIACFHLMIFVNGQNDWLRLLWLLVPVPLLWGFVMIKEGISLFTGLGRTFFLLSQNISRFLGLYLLLFFSAFLFFLLIDTSLIWFFLDVISWLVHLKEEAMLNFSTIVLTFITLFIFQMLFAMVLLGIGLQYYTLKEIKEAETLRSRIRYIGQHKNIKGIEIE
ncbi:MAG TPA: stage II sporulation protein M [Saprospiraceae bacterium]|nr:stage II sporulation protein M [Saprospiraceae bacterium]HMQ85433.1 stage II sporulation protein M [Saprospiraceae bacterium]